MKYKKGFLIFCVGVLHLNCICQDFEPKSFFWGIESGLSFNKMERIRHAGVRPDLLEFHYATNIKYGIVYGIAINRHFGIKTGFLLGRQTQHITLNENDWDNLNVPWFHLKNVEIPFLLRYKIPWNNNNLSFNMGFDLRNYTNDESSGNYSAGEGYIDENSKIQKVSVVSYWSQDEMSGLLFSLHFETFFTLNINNDSYLAVGLISSLNLNKLPVARGYYGFLDNNDQPVGVGEFELKNSYFGISISFLIER